MMLAACEQGTTWPDVGLAVVLAGMVVAVFWLFFRALLAAHRLHGGTNAGTEPADKEERTK